MAMQYAVVSAFALLLTGGLFGAFLARPALMPAVVGPMALACDLLLLACALQMSLVGRRFLKQVPVLETEEDLASYWRVVSRMMHLTLVLGILASATIILVAFSLATNAMPLAAVWLSVIAFLVALGVKTVELLTVEHGLKKPPTACGPIRAERDRIVAVWDGKILPRR
jgi:hypothetical protein